MLREPLVNKLVNMKRGMVVADTAISINLLKQCAFFSAVFKYSSKVFSVVAVSDNPLNKDDRYSLSLDFVETSRVLVILPSKSMRRKITEEIAVHAQYGRIL